VVGAAAGALDLDLSAAFWSQFYYGFILQSLVGYFTGLHGISFRWRVLESHNFSLE